MLCENWVVEKYWYYLSMLFLEFIVREAVAAILSLQGNLAEFSHNEVTEDWRKGKFFLLCLVGFLMVDDV